MKQERNSSLKRKAVNNSQKIDILTSNNEVETKDAKNLLEPHCENSQTKFLFQYLPDLVLESIFGHLTFHEIAILRIVCRRFDEIGKRLLNKGYRNLHQNISEPFQNAGELTLSFKRYFNDNISLLHLTFYPHINANRCCFFPGKIIDVISEMCLIKNKDDAKSIKRQTGVYESLTFDRMEDIEGECNKALKYAVENIFPTFNISAESTSVVLPSPIPLDLEGFFLKSVLGKLRYFDFPALSCSFRDLEPHISWIKNHLKMIKIKYDNPIRGLDRDFVPEKILGMFTCNKDHLLLVQWKEQNEAEFVHGEQLYEKFENIVKKYYCYQLFLP